MSSPTTTAATPTGTSTDSPRHTHLHLHTTDPVIEWSTHSFCSYSICRAALPFREAIHEPHDMSIHFNHSRTSSSSSTDSNAAPHRISSSISSGKATDTETGKSSVISTGRDEWLGVDEKNDAEGEKETGEGLSPILSEEF